MREFPFFVVVIYLSYKTEPLNYRHTKHTLQYTIWTLQCGKGVKQIPIILTTHLYTPLLYTIRASLEMICIGLWLPYGDDEALLLKFSDKD